MALIQSGSGTTSNVTIDATSKAARVNIYRTDGTESSKQFSITYAAVGVITAPAATATDIVRITGSQTKTIKVTSLELLSSNTLGGGSALVVLARRYVAPTGGTFVAATAVPLDSNDAAATATVGHYTANPTIGTTLTPINTIRLAIAAATPTAFAAGIEWGGTELLPWHPMSLCPEPISLRGRDDSLVVNLNGAALLTGQAHAYRVIWEEE